MDMKDMKVLKRWCDEGRVARNKIWEIKEKGSLCTKEDYDPVINCFTECLKQNDCYSSAYEYRGNAYLEQGEYDKAIADYTKLISLTFQFSLLDYNESEVAGYYVLRGDAYVKKNEQKKAFHDYNKAIESCSNLIDKITKGEWRKLIRDPHQGSRWAFRCVYLTRGKIYVRKKEYDKAIADCNSAIKIGPKDSYPYIERGKVYFKKKEYDKAIADYTKAIKINGIFSSVFFGSEFSQESTQHEDVYVCLGDMYSQKKECNKAIAAYIKAAESFCWSGSLREGTAGPPYKESRYYKKVRECMQKVKCLGGKISNKFLKNILYEFD
ncbi:MAG: tetratricopeptide repeat protein [Syntrophales bacterium]|nr:tetratricopeptide repeat protein [Syntrophales bacterium]